MDNEQYAYLNRCTGNIEYYFVNPKDPINILMPQYYYLCHVEEIPLVTIEKEEFGWNINYINGNFKEFISWHPGNRVE